MHKLDVSFESVGCLCTEEGKDNCGEEAHSLSFSEPVTELWECFLFSTFSQFFFPILLAVVIRNKLFFQVTMSGTTVQPLAVCALND